MKQTALSIMLLTGLMASGCGILEPKTTIDGKELRASEVVSYLTGKENAVKAEQSKAEARAKAEQRAARQEAESALADLNAVTAISDVQARQRLAEIKRTAQAKLDTSMDNLDLAAERTGNEAKEIAAQFDTATADLNAKAAQAQGVFAGVLNAAKNIPGASAVIGAAGGDAGLGGLFTLLLGGGGMAVLNARSKKREDAAWDESHKVATEYSEAKSASDQQAAMMAALIGRFDTNKNGKLDPSELAEVKA